MLRDVVDVLVVCVSDLRLIAVVDDCHGDCVLNVFIHLLDA